MYMSQSIMTFARKYVFVYFELCCQLDTNHFKFDAYLVYRETVAAAFVMDSDLYLYQLIGALMIPNEIIFRLAKVISRSQ